mmetsp:Transcript_40997/g.86157  ORF Transcript_40997/g.86157 Transcript_40997/m.86157 type:complete len:242 (-) Transcript_40997:68-793(-)
MSRMPPSSLSTERVETSCLVGSDSSTFQKRMVPSSPAARTVDLSIQLHLEMDTFSFVDCTNINGSFSGSVISNTLNIPSCPPVANLLESPLQSHVFTTCLCGNTYKLCPLIASHTRTEKSPLAVPANSALGSRRHDHTAPLCPENVPIQSPVVAERSMGILSWHAETRKVRVALLPSVLSLSFSSMVQNWSSARGRVWPGQTMGICRPVVPGAEEEEVEVVGSVVAGATAAMVASVFFGDT